MKIAIVSDDRPGHFNQSFGVSKIISENRNASTAIIESKLKINPLRSVIRLYQRSLVKNFNVKNAKKIIDLYEIKFTSDYDLIISSGGDVAYLSASLSKVFGIKNIHVGSVKYIDLKYFDLHITLEKYEDSPNNLVTELSPTKYTPVNNEVKKNKILFLIGGDGAGYSYSIDDWKLFIKNIIKLKGEYNITPIIVTSRRTNPVHEKYIFNHTIDIADNLSLWQHKKEKPKHGLDCLFNEVDGIYVTEDSGMMTTEAISSGMPVCTIYPKSSRPNARFDRQLKKYESMKLIIRQPFNSNFKRFSNNLNSSDRVIEIKEKLKNNIYKYLSI